MTEVTLRPLMQGEYAEPRLTASNLDEFGRQAGYAVPPPFNLDEQGAMAVVVDGQLSGTVSWVWQRWGPNAGSRNPMIGIWLVAEARGRGIGTQAQRALVDLIFRHVSCNRVEAHTDVENIAEQRALSKVGFTQEGIVRAAQWRNGRYRDGYLYSMLRSEWVANQQDSEPEPRIGTDVYRSHP